ncbi:putative extracellular serine carboxypeptidase [Fulvia fulva]|uniref:Extracellular serine carboxypeptidase n=1 Tax=Passalora fulva TaxID=5499 RepID=A0A9Q8UWT5_PASFU|nr:putative extracellular serine carboxypeptidase [Fulvia fulva]KAK4609724.1 putative extracellular serine carboxypeptidase [Fulvia fulva]UJO25361.1 putative extracellular serine carboxypeptidase [Fulvia fulva]WPV22480.1 putative extracellular serine carboxypeptidase [Fulvia fulva]
MRQSDVGRHSGHEDIHSNIFAKRSDFDQYSATTKVEGIVAVLKPKSKVVLMAGLAVVIAAYTLELATAEGYNTYALSEFGQLPMASLLDAADSVLTAILKLPTAKLEHRYWGMSSPFASRTTSNLKYLTIEQALEDITYFAKNIELPFLTDVRFRTKTLQPHVTPWLLVVGGYAGVLAVWTSQKAPTLFWAYLASSPAMIASEAFSQFNEAAIEYGPKNCSRDVMLVIEHIDAILEHGWIHHFKGIPNCDLRLIGNRSEIHDLKSVFGLERLQDDDFAFVLHIGHLQWAEASISREFAYFGFCDYIEGVFGPEGRHIPDAFGEGLQRAINGYALYIQVLRSHCAGANYTEYQVLGNDVLCWDTYEFLNPKFTDISINDGAIRRQWKWLTCNEPYATWPAPPPPGQPSLMSRFVTPGRYARECRLTFPAGEGESFGLKDGTAFKYFNDKYDERSISPNSKRVIYSNGRMDPYFPLSVSSPTRPGGPSNGPPASDVHVLVHPEGAKDDLFMSSGRGHLEMGAVQDTELELLTQ